VVRKGDSSSKTRDGQLNASAVNLFDFSNGVVSTQARINPSTSTGSFAGATGYLFFNGVGTTSGPFVARLEITGQICNADDDDN